MSTPAQHLATAESLLTAATTNRGAFVFAPERTEFDIIEAHTILSRALGTGAHYTAAEATLALVKQAGHFVDVDQLNVALAHARLADR